MVAANKGLSSLTGQVKGMNLLGDIEEVNAGSITAL